MTRDVVNDGIPEEVAVEDVVDKLRAGVPTGAPEQGETPELIEPPEDYAADQPIDGEPVR